MKNWPIKDKESNVLKNFFVLEMSKVARYAIPFAVSIKHLMWKRPEKDSDGEDEQEKPTIFNGKTKSWDQVPSQGQQSQNNWSEVKV